MALVGPRTPQAFQPATSCWSRTCGPSGPTVRHIPPGGPPTSTCGAPGASRRTPWTSCWNPTSGSGRSSRCGSCTGWCVFMLGPEANHYITVSHASNFLVARKPLPRSHRASLGDGLLTIDGDFHRRLADDHAPRLPPRADRGLDRRDDRGDRALPSSSFAPGRPLDLYVWTRHLALASRCARSSGLDPEGPQAAQGSTPRRCSSRPCRSTPSEYTLRFFAGPDSPWNRLSRRRAPSTG